LSGGLQLRWRTQPSKTARIAMRFRPGGLML
jgi:hypothetical protein